jgi:hypothetical protein
MLIGRRMRKLDYSEEVIERVSITAAQIGWRGRKRRNGRWEREEGRRKGCLHFIDILLHLHLLSDSFICSQTALSADFSVCAFLFFYFDSSLLFCFTPFILVCFVLSSEFH